MKEIKSKCNRALSLIKWLVYFGLFIISFVLIIVFSQNNVACNIGCSILASVFVAVLIDMADSIRRKQTLNQQRLFLLCEYQNSIHDLIWDMIEQEKYMCSQIEHQPELLFSQWLDLLFCSASNNGDNGDIFEWTAFLIHRVESASNYFSAEQAVLLFSEVFKSEDIAFFRHQVLQCKSVQRYCDKRDVDCIKSGILRLLKKHEKQYGENLLGKYYSKD